MTRRSLFLLPFAGAVAAKIPQPIAMAPLSRSDMEFIAFRAIRPLDIEEIARVLWVSAMNAQSESVLERIERQTRTI